MDDTIPPLRETLDKVTEEQLRKALAAARGSVPVAAMTLNLSEATVYRHIRKYGIELERVVV
jgi:transcriptional regulator of acetoin/glycerol metabolism